MEPLRALLWGSNLFVSLATFLYWTQSGKGFGSCSFYLYTHCSNQLKVQISMWVVPYSKWAMYAVRFKMAKVCQVTESCYTALLPSATWTFTAGGMHGAWNHTPTGSRMPSVQIHCTSPWPTSGHCKENKNWESSTGGLAWTNKCFWQQCLAGKRTRGNWFQIMEHIHFKFHMISNCSCKTEE